jgi:hypothetical protein
MILSGCRVSVGNRERPLVRQAPIRGAVEFEAEMSDDKQKTVNTDIRNKSTEMRELLRLQTRGDIYHPNLLLYDAMVALGLSQSRFDSDGEISSDQGSVTEYHFAGQMLSTKPYPSSFYFDRTDDIIPRLFGSPLNVETESRGYTQSLDWDDWSMSLSYNDRYSKQEGSGETEERDFFEVDEKNYYYSLGYKFSELSEIQFKYDRREVTQERFNSTTDRQDDRFSLRHIHYFDPEKRYRFESYYNYLEQSKDSDLKQTLWTERLRLRHTDRFETFYNMLYSDVKRTNTSSDRLLLETGLLHRLYESLNTTGRLFTSENNDNDTTEDIWGGDLGFDYTKRNPWGRLSADYFVGYQDLDRSGGDTIASKVNEPHPFVQSQPSTYRFFLDEANVDQSTIEVFGGTTGIEYTRGIDYTVAEISGLTEISIVLTGDIFNGPDQILRINYDYFPGGDRLEESFTQIFRVRQDFRNGLSVYYEYHIKDQDITTDDPDFIPDEYIKNIVGTEYVKGGLLLAAEYRDEDATRLPAIRKSVSGSYLWVLDQDTQVNFFASNDWIEYTEESNDIVQFSIGTGLFSRLSDRYSLTSNFVYRDEDDSIQGDTQGYDWSTELRYVFRQFSYSTGLQLSSLDHLDQETDNLFFYFRARREF